MTAAIPTTNPGEAIANSALLQTLVQQIRANDPYGTYRNWDDALLLKPYLVSKAEKREIPLDGTVDPLTQSRILAFYRAIAYRIEQETGVLSQVVLDLNSEGFGWALVFAGRLLLVSKTLRDAHRFGFPTLEKLSAEGTKLVERGIALAQAHPDIAEL